ncbi:hypothetical protein DFH07DRAFT_926926 [Mycena maculata]|uniref:JmjC domain-containing protein n=1 Tax=Mycena maculata TaxID=230809 RepID=A0AAD7N019_9AGAR|nr:hypothetical protein DFH07DRAFT_926926 [Mycena maculata]
MDWQVNALRAVQETLQAQDVALCGPLLHKLVTVVKETFSDTDSTGPSDPLDAIVAEAYENLAKTSLYCWRRLHTDASILSALVSPPEAAIAKLDTAIILSGAAGNARLDLILDIIECIQAEHLPSTPLSGQNFVADSEHLIAQISTKTAVIPSLPTPPSLAAFQAREHAAPFILRGYARDWPALTERPWASTAYLRAVAGRARVVPVEVGRDYRTDDWTQKIMPWDAFLDALESPTELLYLAQHSLLMQFPALRADIVVPDYVYAALPRPVGSAPPANDEQLVINAWLGPKDTVSPAHTDPYFNMYVQVAGYKTVWMAAPETDGMLATGNTSAVDVFATDQSYLAGQMAILGPGDVLYLPPGWWHAMRAECRSFSVSMWF